MARKIVQIAASSDHLYVLCNDGVIFQLGQDGEWIETKPIPPGSKSPRGKGPKDVSEAEVNDQINEIGEQIKQLPPL
jgi:alpha-tubulin suppressor-like RCC1 family protein